MTPTQQIAFDKIQNRVNVFHLHKANYKADETNETETRTDFIDPFFEALGWDMKN
jgi:adenine-specific DNA-methyltransferase